MSNFTTLARAAMSDSVLHGPVAAKQDLWQALCEERGIRLCPENLMRPSHVMRRPGTGPRTHTQPALADVLAEASPRISARIAARLTQSAKA